MDQKSWFLRQGGGLSRSCIRNDPIGSAKRLGSCWVPGWWDASPDQAADESAEQGFAAATGVMHELKETEIQRQFVLRDAAVRAQPGAQQRPEALDGVDVHLADPIAIFIARILAVSVADRLVAVAPSWQPGVDVVV